LMAACRRATAGDTCVCRDFACQAPADDPGELARLAT
jgi:hypothetical protein